MKRYTRLLSAVAIVCALALATAVAASASAASAAKATTLTVWTNSADPPYVTAVYTRFARKFHVKLNIIKIAASSFETATQTKWESGARPDILEYHPTSLFWALDPAKTMVPLNSMAFAKRSGNLYQAACNEGGKIYCAVTEDPSVFGAFYNKHVLSSNGLSAPKSYADLLHDCTVLKPKGIATIAESGGAVWPLQITGGLAYIAQAQKTSDYAGQLLAKKTTLSAPNGPFVKGLTVYQQLASNGCFNSDSATSTYQNSESEVVKGTAAMTFLHSGLITDFDTLEGGKSQADAAIGWATPSATQSVASWAPGPSGTWFVPKTGNSRKEAVAEEFVKWATGPDYQTYLNQSKDFPIIKGGKQAPGAQQLQKEVAASFKSASLAFNTNLPGFNADFATTMSKLLAGQITPQVAGQQSQEQLAQGAAAAHLKGW